MTKIKVLLIKDTTFWASQITVSNIIKHIDSEFQCDERVDLEYRQNDEEFDIVYIHCNGGVRENEIKSYRKKNKNSKLIAGVRGWKGFKKTKDFLHLYDAVNADNLKLYRAVKEIYSKVHLCHAGVDTKLFKPQQTKGNERFTIGWAGNKYQPVKNFILLPKLSLPYKIATKKKRKRKSFYPQYPHSEMPNFYNSIDVLVQLSSWGPEQPEKDVEGCPLPVLEAGACGKPVLATHTSGAAREYLDEYQIIKGYIRGDGLEEMKRKLLQLKDDAELRHRLGERNRRVAVEEWDWSIKVKQYETFFKSVL